MKRSVAFILAIAILGAVAFCFLRPVPGEVQFIIEDKSDKVYTFTEPQPFELSGKDTELIEAVYVRTASLNEHPALVLALRSADGRCYTLGSSVFENGKEHQDRELEREFFTERYENGGWTVCENGKWSVSEISIWSPNHVKTAFSSTDPLSFPFPLNTDKPGRYRITFYFRDYIPASSEKLRSVGSSGDGLYEASFEYDVPGRSPFSWEPKVAGFSMPDWTDDPDYAEIDGTFTQISLLITNLHLGSYGYLQSDESELMRRTSSGEYIPDDTVHVTYDLARNNCIDYPERTRAYYVRPVMLNLLYWEYGAEYRLTLVFTENEDGTGERCSVTLDLRFDE